MGAQAPYGVYVSLTSTVDILDDVFVYRVPGDSRGVLI